jgi:hypothetical protein
MLFPNNYAVFQDDTAGNVVSWFKEHEGELPTSFLASTITRFEQH